MSTSVKHCECSDDPAQDNNRRVCDDCADDQVDWEDVFPFWKSTSLVSEAVRWLPSTESAQSDGGSQ